MKIKVNIELIDDKHDLAWHENLGLTKKTLINLNRAAFTALLDEISDGLRYTLDIEVED